MSQAIRTAPAPVVGDRRAVGHALVGARLITEDQRAWAETISAETGRPIETVLIAAGVVPRLDLYRVLAELWGCEYVDLTAIEPDRTLLARLDPRLLADQGWFPVRREGGVVVVATAEPPTAARTAAIEEHLGVPVVLQVTTEWDVLNAVHTAFRDVVVEQATLGLWRRDSRQSARTTLFPGQRVALWTVLGGLAAGLWLAPRTTLTTVLAVISVGFLVSVLFKFVVSMVGARQENRVLITDEQLADLDPRDLPTYTVLVPLYREANVVGDLIANLERLDYPREKLQILVLLEEDDAETIAAAKAADPPATITLLIVPKGAPQTKPKACNVGLFFAKGDLLVIYDAEDRPEPDQLRKAAAAFRLGGDRLVCVQAALNYWNAEENWLTRMFTLEYSFWFDYMLPGLDRLGLPIPLGGTSNHFRTRDLRRLGGWDPFNVTEDADLGIRAATLGSRVGVINSTTFEEANRATGNWIRQRSRWIKGYLQTLIVHMRQPGTLVRTVGPKQVAAFWLLIGGTPASFLFTPPLHAMFVLSLILPDERLAGLLDGWVLWVGLASLIFGNGLMIYVSMMGAFKRRRYRLVLWALFNPVYWLLHAVASYKALWQLITKPHYWEKTIHGLSNGNHDPADAPAPGHTVPATSLAG